MAHSDNSDDLNQPEMTEGTNMMVDMLANTEKLINTDERWYYSKKNNNNDDNDNDDNNDYDDEVDDDFDSYKKPEKRTENYSDKENRTENRTETRTETRTDTKPENKSSDKYVDDEYEGLPPLEKRLRRLDFMRKLGELRDLGCKVTNYSIDDDYYMMKYEYELHTSIRNKRNWMGLYNHMLIGGVKLLELGNDRYNPFDFSLKGLGNEISSDKTTYYEILGEIYEHYNVPGKKMNPWFRLAINLIGTVAIVGGKNNAHKFLPRQANEVENNESMLENLRAKAMNQTQPQNQNQPQKNLDEFMNKEHDKAAQRVKDLEDLKRQDLEFQQYQKMLAEDNSKFVNMKKQLEMSQQSPKSASASAASSRSKSILRNKKEESDSRSTLSNQTSESSVSSKSTVSVNKKLASQLNSKQSIKASAISFGSSNKGKKQSISIGGR